MVNKDPVKTLQVSLKGGTVHSGVTTILHNLVHYLDSPFGTQNLISWLASALALILYDSGISWGIDLGQREHSHKGYHVSPVLICIQHHAERLQRPRVRPVSSNPVLVIITDLGYL